MPTKRAADGPSSPPVKKKVASAITKNNMANFFKPTSEKIKDVAALAKATWTEKAPDEKEATSLLVARFVPDQGAGEMQSEVEAVSKSSDPAAPKRKIAAFDLDSTLILPASGKKYPKGVDDWKWWDATVPQRLKKLHADGFLISIFSNQAGLTLHPDPKSKAPTKSDKTREYKGKCDNILRALNLPITLYAATAKDRFRKPQTGMWDSLLSDNGLAPEDIDMASSFFVGDAAGRPARGVRKTRDFSCSDRNLAANLGLKFSTPEEFFHGEAAEAFERDFEPGTVARSKATGDSDSVSLVAHWQKKYPREIVLFCGPPGAGKSSFWWRHCEPQGYERINQDLLGSRDNCFKAATEGLKSTKSSLVIDNTNADPSTRAMWVALAKEKKIPIRCVHFTTPINLCIHNDSYRSSGKMPDANPEKRARLPGIAFSSFTKRYVPPKKDEGFADITDVEFQFYGADSEFAVWSKYWS
ncbi:Bifunctional polynucleotide phosphatase/kinase [Ceratocystis fimbriata CBS 114723]|uniref:Bifunctional polynucleotide phosphatase/kinase n=1 Tax=Ceratocystis fimbriata CBS 114723 TaxID=1035309 RepID=A0A2C5XF90_9PEZI|nr:Bifunctional polynucleotide phosphatase/kinase [Ceratocystis fimbriata CBS 114723]